MNRLPAALLGTVLSAIRIRFLFTGEMHAENGKPQYVHLEALASTD